MVLSPFVQSSSFLAIRNSCGESNHGYLRSAFVAGALTAPTLPCQAQQLTPLEKQVEEAQELAKLVVDLLGVGEGCGKFFYVDAVATKRSAEVNFARLNSRHPRSRVDRMMGAAERFFMDDVQGGGWSLWCTDAKARLDKAGHGALFRR